MIRDDGGQALIEFALILPIFMLLVFGLIDVARAVEEENTLAFAAREGTRYAIVHGSGASSPLTYCGETIHTATAVTSAGSTTITVADTSWNLTSAFATGGKVLADSGVSSTNMETVTLTGVTGTTLTATFALTHSGTWYITASCPTSNATTTTITSVVQDHAIGVPSVTTVIGYPDSNNDRGNRVYVEASAAFIPLPSQYLLGSAYQITLRGGSMLAIQH